MICFFFARSLTSAPHFQTRKSSSVQNTSVRIAVENEFQFEGTGATRNCNQLKKQKPEAKMAKNKANRNGNGKHRTAQITFVRALLQRSSVGEKGN